MVPVVGTRLWMVLDGPLCSGGLENQPGVDPPGTSRVKYRGSVLRAGGQVVKHLHFSLLQIYFN